MKRLFMFGKKGKSEELKTQPTLSVAPKAAVETSASRSKLVSAIRKNAPFEFYAPFAKAVTVAGTFNSWSPTATSLKKAAGGKWILELELPLGRHEYRYVVDGAWQNDQRPVESTPNPFGGFNNVVQLR